MEEEFVLFCQLLLLSNKKFFLIGFILKKKKKKIKSDGRLQIESFNFLDKNVTPVRNSGKN